MANRNFNSKQSLEKGIKELYADVSIAAAGAPTLNKKLGITSVVRVSAGVYDITLDDTYSRLMSCQVSQIVSTAQDLTWQIVSETVTSTKTIRIRGLTAAVATDPSSGSRLLVQINLKNTSVNA